MNSYCQCEDVAVGSYDNQVMIPRPECMKDRKEGSENSIICVDTCLANEIQKLWRLGIRTTGCCCGHRKHQGYIGVILEDAARMRELGYEYLEADRTDHFKPKGHMKEVYPDPDLQAKYEALQKAISILDNAGFEHIQMLASWNMDGNTRSYFEGTW